MPYCTLLVSGRSVLPVVVPFPVGFVKRTIIIRQKNEDLSGTDSAGRVFYPGAIYILMPGFMICKEMVCEVIEGIQNAGC